MWWTVSALATTWTIPGDFPDLDTAVDSPSLTDGDELIVGPGVFQAPDLSNTQVIALSIRGQGPSATMLTSQSSEVLRVENLDLQLSDLTVDGEGVNQAVRVKQQALLTLSNVDIVNGAGGNAGNLIVENAMATADQVFIGNGTGNAGGIQVRNSGTLHGTNMTLQGNVGDQGGGVSVDNGSFLNLANSQIIGNDADEGGGLWVQGEVFLTNVEINGNNAVNRGGGIKSEQGRITVSGSTFGQNTAAAEGGAIEGRGEWVISTTQFDGNAAETGGAISISGPGGQPVSTLTNVSFCANSANISGQAIHIVDGNHLLDIYNAVFYAQTGAAPQTVYSQADLRIENSTFHANAGTHAIAADNSALDVHGVVFSGTGLNTTASGIVSFNVFESAALLTGSPLPGDQVFGDPLIDETLGCQPWVGFSHATAPLTLDIAAGPFDLDGSDADAGHLGGPLLNVAYFGADPDSDGALVHVDCDETDPAVNPNATEVCDLIDNDCDTLVDEAGQLLFVDNDLDTYGTGAPTEACPGPGFSTLDGDCNDNEPGVNPAAIETCNGVDDNCLNGIDDGLPLNTYYNDDDDDGFGAGAVSVQTCESTPPADYTLDSSDCDDTDATIYPGAEEVCDGADNDCSGGIDNGLPFDDWYLDQDSDGFGTGTALNACAFPGPGYVVLSGDCDDLDSSSYPTAPEQCDGIDHNCNGDPSDGIATTNWYLDGDDDGFGAGAATADCASPGPDYVTNHDDCDDTDSAISPNATEQCDAIDRNCNGDPEDGVPQLDWYLDVDQDGFGTGTAVEDCAPVPNHSTTAGDCNDGNSLINPDADETCDGADNDCDGDVDDADTNVTDAPPWYLDDDGDSFGDPHVILNQCSEPADYVDRAGDCNDADANIFEGAPEACEDFVDNDCDGLVDADDPDYSFAPVEYANDADDDGYGDPSAIIVACSGAQPAGYVPLVLGEDCADGDPDRNPGEAEVCDNIDNDCFGGVDNGLPFLDYFVDQDGDLFGDPNALPVNACEAPPGTSGNGLDCDDDDPAVNPYAPEQCNDADDDCDNAVDEDLATVDYYPDLDQDGYGDASATPTADCAPIDDEVTDHTDCDDDDNTIFPGAPEEPEDGIDSDCDGTVEEILQPLVDTDGDGIPDLIDVNPVSEGTEERPAAPLPTYGCGCQQAGGASWIVALLAGVLVRRRRQLSD